MLEEYVRCPKCGWEPDETCRWVCDVCDTRWNTFETHGQCPGCNKVFVDTSCSRSRGGCGYSCLNSDWYAKRKKLQDYAENTKSIWFWKNRSKLPITLADKQWIERDLLWLVEMIEPFTFSSLITNLPKDYSIKLVNIEEHAEWVLKKLTSIMNIDGWEIKLMFFSNRPEKFSDGTIATPSDKLDGGWESPTGNYINNGFGNKEIWVEEEQLNDGEGLVALMAHQLANFKILNQYNSEKKDELLADLIAVVYGFGIFMGNSYFKFSTWTETSHHGWRMRRSGYLPKQLIAYAMAWTAQYRNEDVQWKHYMNKTMRKYFDQCYKYIGENKEQVRWS